MKERESWQNLGHRIRKLRKESQLTLKRLAAGCELSVNAISLIERGRVAPTVMTLCKIAHALGVSAGSLFQDIYPAEVILTRVTELQTDQYRVGALLATEPSRSCGYGIPNR
jgi:transcriptional regulator with XRE-family HTH domain